MSNSTDHYVYVYIDPRNYEEFYYGKGIRNRKSAHLKDASDTEKARRIREIAKAGLKPIIKVIAKDLTEEQAFLIEKTLIWKLGRQLTNMSSGHFSEKFRPHHTFHQDLPGFDFKNGIYYVNVGEGKGKHRLWIDCMKFGFLSAGGGKKWADQIKGLKIGDIVVAFLKGHGYVGVGRVKEEAVGASDFALGRKRLSELPLKCRIMLEHSANPDKSEYLVKVEWLASVPANKAEWVRRSGLFSTQLVRASLLSQKKTIDFIGTKFKLKLGDLLLKVVD